MENKLITIVKESNLEQSKAQFILEKFQDFFAVAAEWEQKAREIKVTDPSQKAEMELAREGRLVLKEKRVALEKARKSLKEQSLREGKAIDGISSTLKALIVPVENYLDEQEHFVEIQEEKKREAHRIEVERRMEEERIAEEKKQAEETARIEAENVKLKKEAEEKDKKAAEERTKANEEKRKIEEKAAADKKAAQDKARKEKEKHEKKLAEERAKADSEREAAEEKARKEKEKARAKVEAERKEKERLAALLKSEVECPKCGNKFQPKKK